MAIAKVGTYQFNYSTSTTTTTLTLSYTTVNLGDLVVIQSTTSSASSIITGLSGGGVTTWTKAASVTGSATGQSLWYGVVTTVGAVTLTVTNGATTGGAFVASVEQFTAGFGASTQWSLDGTPVTGSVTSASTTLTFPTLTAAAANELWYGYVSPQNVGSVGSTSGFTYQREGTAAAPDYWSNIIAYRLTTGSGAVTAPTASQDVSGTYVRIGALFVAAQGTQTVTATGIGSAEVFGAHTVTPGPVSLAVPAGIASAEVFGSHALAQALTITAGITSGEVFGSATLSGALLASGIPSGEAFGASTLTVGPVSVTPTGIVSGEAFGSQTITGSVLHPTGIGTAETFGAHTVSPGPVTLTVPAGIGTAETFGATHVVQVVKALGSVAPKAAVLVRYELVCVARIPQTSGAPTLLQVDPIDWTGLSYTDELSKAQQLNVGAKITSLTEPILQRLRDLAHNPMELWLYRNSKLVFAGPLFGWQVQGTGQAITLQAAGLLGYLQLMEIETDVTFAQADQFTIATTLINAWQNTPYGHYGIDTSSVGASGVLRDATYLAKEQNTVAKRVEELGKRDNGFDVSVDPTTRKLQLAYPIAGVDRSIGEDAIIFDERNITNPNVVCSCAPGDVASDAFGTGTSVGGGDPTISTKWSDDLRARYGRAAVAASFDSVSDQTTLDAHVQGLLDVRQAALMIPGPDVRVTPDTDLSLYDVGDTVFYRLHSQLGLEGGFRLRKRTVTVKTTGQESVSLAFA